MIVTSDPADADGDPGVPGKRERRWLVIASDGRHSTLGRATDPSPEELDRIAGSLCGMGLAGWLVVSEGWYYRPEPMQLLVVRQLAELEGATWEAAKTAFMAAREAASTP